MWTLLALMAAVLALYHQAAWAFGRPAPVRTQWFTMTAGVYAFAALPGAGELAEVLALAGLGGWMLVFSFRISALSAGAARPEAQTARSRKGLARRPRAQRAAGIERDHEKVYLSPYRLGGMGISL